MSLQAHMLTMCVETKQVGKEGLTLAAACVQTSTRICKNGPRVFGLINEQVSTQSCERCTVLRPAVDAHLQNQVTPLRDLCSRPKCCQQTAVHTLCPQWHQHHRPWKKEYKEYRSSAGRLCSADMGLSQTDDPSL